MSKEKKITRKCLEWALSRYEEIAKQEEFPYRKFSHILEEVKMNFKDDSHFKKVKDVGQSWKTILGSVLEGLIEYSLESELVKINLKCTKPTKSAMGEHYKLMEEQLSISIGGSNLIPDADRVVYKENPFEIIAILSIKKKFRERIAQVGYWTIQLRTAGKKIKNIMVTTDENGTFTKSKLKKDRVKAKAIAREHTNRTFVASEAEIEENGKLKKFNKIIEFLKKLGESEND